MHHIDSPWEESAVKSVSMRSYSWGETLRTCFCLDQRNPHIGGKRQVNKAPARRAGNDVLIVEYLYGGLSRLKERSMYRVRVTPLFCRSLQKTHALVSMNGNQSGACMSYDPKGRPSRRQETLVNPTACRANTPEMPFRRTALATSFRRDVMPTYGDKR